METIGEKVKRLRIQKGLSETGLATKIGSVGSTIKNLERTSSTTTDVLARVCKVFEIPLRYFFEEIDETQEKTEVEGDESGQ